MKRIDYLKKSNACYLIMVFMFVAACVDRDVKPQSPAGEENLDTVEVPEEFEFETSGMVEINIQDANIDELIKYSIYSFGADTLNDLVATGFTDNSGSFSTVLNLPNYLQKVYVVRNHKGKFDGFALPIESGTVSLNYTEPGGKTGRYFSSQEGCTEVLYAVNSKGRFFTIDNESGSYTETTLPDLDGGGSIACAVDRANRKTYYNTGTTLRYYDIDNNTFHIVSQGNPFNGNYPRMEYNNTDGFLYIAKNENMYIIDPLSNRVISNISISGIQSPVSGGDLAISLDGTIYMCTFSGLYRIEIAGEGNTAEAIRISAEGLPFQPTSMAIDRNDRLYLATNDSNSRLIEMDKFDGAWQVVQTYNHTINDLGSLPCRLDELDDTDSDGDGINDPLDEFPDDPERAGETFTPSKYGWGSLAFEDLWPAKGDFDYNDLVVNYRFIAVINASNKIVELKAKFNVRAIGASFKNGFGFEMPVSPALISSVSGFRLNENIVTVDAKGLEAGQSNAVVIVFDNAFNELPHVGGRFINTEPGFPVSTGEDIEINIVFEDPIDPESLGAVPFNPFIFIDGERGKELHLKDKKPTDLADNSYFNTLSDASNVETAQYYKTSNNVPFAIDIIHEFRYPIEQKPINEGYNYFVRWATSGGNIYKDWYKDNAGYRNDSKIYD